MATMVDGTQSEADVIEHIDSSKQQYVDNDGFTAAIIYKGEIAGVISLMGISWNHKSTAIGYWLAHKYTGNGIMTKCCKALVDYAFKELELHRIEIQCAEGNVRSRAIPERLGFKIEGTIRESEYLYDHYVSHKVYGMLRSEWA